MKPKSEFITITDNLNKAVILLQELVLQPRLKALEWSRITKQTPNLKIGYPGQHLASLITGVEGARTGARGDDLRDGSEAKSCSRVDQLDSCVDCGNRVLRIEESCPHCGSTSIKRMNDSKWLFAIKSEEELKLLTQEVDRVFLTLADYPNFISNDYSEIRFQAFEIWTKTERHKHFTTLMSNYYYKIFLEHIKHNPKKTPAPKNFWPYSYQFYLCNPVKVFSCIVSNANIDPRITIEHYVEPDMDRSLLEAEKMPVALLSLDELRELITNAPPSVIEAQIINGTPYDDIVEAINFPVAVNKRLLHKAIPFIDEQARSFLQLRDTDVIALAKTKYTRR